MGKYDDIIHLAHHESKTRRHMSMTERAAQFGAFKALRGHEEALNETARVTETMPELDEQSKQKINEKLVFLAARANEQPHVRITYFKPDDKKQGGACVTVCGRVKRIKDYEKMLIMADGTEILIDHILEIECQSF